MISDLQKKTAKNVFEKANLIWSVADKLVGVYKPHEYGNVILPMCVIKRFNDALAPTRAAVLEEYKNVKDLEVKEGFLTDASGYPFYNISNYDFDILINDSGHIEDNFRAYLNGFSENVQDILSNFDFEKEIKKLTDNDLLFLVIETFNGKDAYLGPDEVSTADMGYIFEELVRKFSESYNEQAGAHFTARDVIWLMTDVLTAEDDSAFEADNTKTVYDMAMGTSQMLSCMEERLKQLDKDADVTLFGQELNDETFAIAKADMLMRGGNADNMRKGDTLSDDKFKDYHFDLILSNPPFGIEWKKEKNAVEAEAKLGEAGRFFPGLPKISDGQMLFDLNGIKKLKDGGRMAIVHNGSSLFTGAAESGESEIRRYILENDWLDAIIQLPNDLFYNTGITTYIWIIMKNKPDYRRDKVQLIDASKMYDSLRKNIGNKHVEISDECRQLIVQAYGEYADKEYKLDNKRICESQIHYKNEFGFNRVTVESPMLGDDGKPILKKGKMTPDKDKRDFENIPMTEDIDEYFAREVLPFSPDAWIDEKKTKVGYEIPFTRFFYKYVPPEKSEDIMTIIKDLEKDISESLKTMFEEA